MHKFLFEHKHGSEAGGAGVPAGVGLGVPAGVGFGADVVGFGFGVGFGVGLGVGGAGVGLPGQFSNSIKYSRLPFASVQL